MAESFLEVPVHALAQHRRVKALRHGRLWTAVEQKKGVQGYLEGVHAELKLAPERVHKLKLNILAGVVGERNEAPAVAVIANLHQTSVHKPPS